MASKMASKMAALAVLLLWVCVAGVTGQCPAECQCGPYINRHSDLDLHVDCSSRGLSAVPDNLPANTKSLNMANNRLTTIDRSAFSYLDLEVINLSGNNIREVPRRAFEIKGRCTFWDLDAAMDYRQRIVNGDWHIHGFKDVMWPCAVDLRNNPISRVDEDAFHGSHNFSILLGQSSSSLTLASSAFMNTANIIGLHVSSVPTLTLSHGSFLWMNTVYWMIIDQTQLAFRGPPFIRETSVDRTTKVQWLRISNSNVLELGGGSLEITMDVQTQCSVTTYPYPKDGNGITRSYSSNIDKGGVEIINNTLPVLPENLFGRSNLAGIYFKDNKIAGFQSGVFARKQRYQYADICLITFSGNRFPSIPSGAFRALKNVMYLNIYGGNFSTIEAEAFADSSNIGSLSIDVSGNLDNEQVIIKSKAFAKINRVKEVYVGGADHREVQGAAKLVLEPNAFYSLNNVDYMTVGLHDNMVQLPKDLFTGITVNQQLELRARDLTKIDPSAFGRKNTGTRINHLYVNGNENVFCDCNTAELGRNVEENVGKVQSLTCKVREDDGFVYNTHELDALCSACSLRVSLVLIFVTSVLLHL